LSKLFDTLEQIRENESYRPPESAVTKLTNTDPPKKRPLRALIMFACIAGLVGYIFLSDVRNSIFPPAGKKDAATITEQAAPVPSVDVGPGRSLQAGPVAESGQSVLYTSDSLAVWQKELQSSEILPERKSVLLNNIGAYYIFHQHYWKGLSFLDEALHIQPRSVEMLVNYAVALAELNLMGAAGVYLEKAFQIDPENPALKRNLALLQGARIVEEKIYSLYTGTAGSR